jgi:hypothetical protein
MYPTKNQGKEIRTTTMKVVSLAIALVLGWSSSSLALSTVAGQSSTIRSSTVFQLLQSTLVQRASDGAMLSLPSQWRHNTPFGVADEISVCAFLRHFGWFLCWEHAAALRDNILPSKNTKLLWIGIGSNEAAKEFADQLNLHAANVFGDVNGQTGDALGFGQGVRTMWNPAAVQQMMARNDETSLKSLGESYKAAAETVGIQTLMPADMKDTLRQGGTFVFHGDLLLLEHYDAKVGDNCSIESIMDAITAGNRR